MFQPMKIKMPPPPQSMEKRLDRIDGGLNVKYVESQISDLQSPYMLNLNCNDRGALTKRSGQSEYHVFSEGPIHAMHHYKDKFVVAHGTKLSTWDGTTETEVMSGLANQKGKFFIVSDTLLYLNGSNYVQWDGVTAKHVEGYIPTITLGRAPTGGGTAYEEWNLLSSGFTDSFSGTGTATAYSLSFGDLDATIVTVKVTGMADPVEGVDFNVNRTMGIVTFNAPPPAGTNNIRITAHKTFEGFKEMVTHCKYVERYGGGSNDSRIFIAGADEYRNMYRWTGLTGNTSSDYRYYPENNFNRIGSDFEYITGFAKYYAKLIVFKEGVIFAVKYQYTSEGSGFPVEQLNSQLGCDMPGSIQIIGNAPVWCHTQYGVYTMIQTLIESEKNIAPLSGNVNGATFRPGLLDETETDLVNCTSVDYDGKYWLCVGKKVWVWDYELSPFKGIDDELKWFPYDNINANCFLIENRELYHGDRATGRMTVFTDELKDYNQPINGVWKSKLFNFDFPDWRKTISEVWATTRSGNNSTINIALYDDNNIIHDVQLIRSKSFSWANFSWGAFTWGVYRFPVTFKKRPKLRKIQHFQIELSNNEVDKNLSVMSLVVRYTLEQKVK